MNSLPMTTSCGDRAAALRAFNRFYTNVIGVLGEGLLRTSHTLTEARVIYELGQVAAADVADLRRALDLDRGYLSRILGRFEDAGLVARSRSDSDRRRQVIRLTDRGRAAYDTLDRRSADDAEALLAALDEGGQRRLIAAMTTIAGLLGDAHRTRTVVVRGLHPGDLGWVIQRHGELYAREYGWDETFEALVARIAADFGERHDPARERGWIAEVDGVPGACVLCVRRDDRTAQLRLLLVEPRARGLGIGARLVEECLAFARSAGYARIMLWTQDCLEHARRIYEAAGFTLEEQAPHRSFGHDLVEQYWSRPLMGAEPAPAAPGRRPGRSSRR
jgi:DNA-binding MarR family transcriptional regulator/N-acetylglutamate synthase-like GNAT family acetyltransferase